VRARVLLETIDLCKRLLQRYMLPETFLLKFVSGIEDFLLDTFRSAGGTFFKLFLNPSL